MTVPPSPGESPLARMSEVAVQFAETLARTRHNGGAMCKGPIQRQAIELEFVAHKIGRPARRPVRPVMGRCSEES
jgi:hypothetical protein